MYVHLAFLEGVWKIILKGKLHIQTEAEAEKYYISESDGKNYPSIFNLLFYILYIIYILYLVNIRKGLTTNSLVSI